MEMENQKVLDVLNSLEVFEMNGGEDAYILVENNKENQESLNKVGVTTETINKYGDEETFCILALAFSEGYANSIEINYGVVRLLHRSVEEFRNEIQVILDSPLTDFGELHEAIQDRLNQY